MIFKILNKIKDIVSTIAKKIEDIESKPSMLLWDVLGTFSRALAMAGIKILG
ncbi:hypothetical protein [Clostridium formicaceticum]|uniref:Uncharacterized protein n=1 Tax=Clostridium formicaceticum TaxID=1497 RepID=A0AAC9RN20_9CLOT|nr:hypothetical protein [Clostridium formicaceticum]ARE87260.1 hypothetical protein CLFO_16590 [Clostridium formicaceticum]